MFWVLGTVSLAYVIMLHPSKVIVEPWFLRNDPNHVIRIDRDVW